MNRAEDMIVDHNMIVTQVFRGLGKRLDRPCIAAKFDLRINHTSFHRPLLFHDATAMRQIPRPEASPERRRYPWPHHVGRPPGLNDDREPRREMRFSFIDDD